VTWRKQRRLILAAKHLLATRKDLRRFAARFDVVALDGALGPANSPRIRWIRNAFMDEQS
jgi:Holliday junction resolvase-like predicted endonuclease